MKKLTLTELELKTFTEQDALDYCQINNINFENIIELDLSDNQLTDILGLKLFKNLEELELYDNKIKDISVLKYFNKLKRLDINDNEITDIFVIQYLKNLIVLGIINLKLESDQIKYIKNLEYLWCKKGFKDMSVLKQLNKNIKVIK